MTSFLEDYIELKKIILWQIKALTEDEKTQISTFQNKAKKRYEEILKQRKIGIDYLEAAISYFAVGDVTQHIEERYTILCASYFFHQQYQYIAELKDSQNKQKEIFDLLRYMAKPILEETKQVHFEDAKEIFRFYLDFMLENHILSHKNQYKAWKSKVQLIQLKSTKFIGYLHSLTIIFKRIADQTLVHRRHKKRKKVIDWPSKAQIEAYKDRHHREKMILDGTTELSISTDVTVDENGDIDAEESEVIIHTTDIRTNRFHRVLSQHTDYLLRHRQRRIQPFLTNPHYMSREVIQALVNILHNELPSEEGLNAPIAAACLLSLSSGLSPIALLNYHQLIKEGRLIQSGDSKTPVYRMPLHLDITQQKIDYLKPYQLNQTRTHDLILSSSWFDYFIDFPVKNSVTITDINQYLRNWTSNQLIGSITVEKLQAQIYMHLSHQTFNEYIAHVVSGKDSHHELPGTFYYGMEQQKLNQHYLIYLDNFKTELVSEEIDWVNKQLKNAEVKQQDRIGSQLALNSTFTRNFFQQLHRLCSNKTAIDQHLIEQLNAYAMWMWHICLLCLSSRPKENLLGNVDDYDLKLRLLYVNDKKNSKARKDGRFIPLSNFFVQAFKRYTTFLEQIIRRYRDLFKLVFNKQMTIDDLFGKVVIYPKQLPTTYGEWASKKIKIQALDRQYVNVYLKQYLNKALNLNDADDLVSQQQQDFELYNNWLRHVDMNMLTEKGLTFNILQALYGHDQRDQELLYRYSSASLNQYVEAVIKAVDQVIKDLGIQHLVSNDLNDKAEE